MSEWSPVSVFGHLLLTGLTLALHQTATEVALKNRALAACTVATAAQSTIGSVFAGSTVALLQGAGARGTSLGTLNGVVQGVGTTVLGSTAYLKTSILKTRK